MIDRNFARNEIQRHRPVQGNLDPLALLAGGATLDREIDLILVSFADRPLAMHRGAAARAVEAMGTVKDRPRVLNVKSQLHEPNGELVTVEDTGPGIDPDRKDRIFDAFFSTKSSGMGMGLFICRSIVESYGGRLWATSAAPHGATFHLVLPVGDAAGGPLPSPEE
jgi:signal transduction histidine kinase